MSMKLYDEFPNINNEKIIIRKMVEDDVEELAEIANNDNVYKFIPSFLYKKSKGNLLAAIRNLGERDFNNKKVIIAGIYLVDEPNKLVGLAEMFDYKEKLNTITIGYRLNEKYWNKGIATNAIKVMLDYLFNQMGLDSINAFVMPENEYSYRALLKNGFKRQEGLIQANNWGGREIVDLGVYKILRSEYV